MTISLISSMDPVYLKMMFRNAYPNKSSYWVIKLPRKQKIRKNIIFAFSDFVLRNVSLAKNLLLQFDLGSPII